MFSFYFLWFELLSLFISIVCFYKIRSSNLIWFIPFLILTNIQEWGSRYGYLTFRGTNTISLNFFTTIEFVFYSWLFFQETNNKKQKKGIQIFTSGYLIVFVLNILFVQGVSKFHSYSYLLGSLMIIYYTCSFFYDLFHKENYVNLVHFPMFWICIGLLFFYTGMFFYYIFFEALAFEYLIKFLMLFNVLMNIFNIILYLSFSIAFICQPIRKNITN